MAITVEPGEGAFGDPDSGAGNSGAYAGLGGKGGAFCLIRPWEDIYRLV